MLRVAVDAGSGGIQGPLFEDGSFEYVPIPDGLARCSRTYGNTIGRRGFPLVDYFPPQRREKMSRQCVHFDPEFESFTYGDPTPPKSGLRNLRPGDLLVFYCGLQGLGFDSPPALYLLGYFEVIKAGLAPGFREDEILGDFGRNHHVVHRTERPGEWNRLVLVKGGPGSRQFTKAVRISCLGMDRSGKPLKILSPEMRGVFGEFGGKLSIQRSPTRWVHPDYVARAVGFVRALA